MAKFFTTNELAEYLSLTPLTIRRKTKTGQIPYIKIGNRLRFDKEQIDQWLHDKTGGQKIKILIVDDEQVIGELFKSALDKSEYQVTSMTSSVKALDMLNDDDFDLVFLDLRMPEIDGAELFRRIREKDGNTPVAIITAYPDSDIMARAMEYGPFTVLKKPFVAKDIIATVQSLTVIKSR